jgi:hypothetical protein
MTQRPVRPRRPVFRPVPLLLAVPLVAGLVALANPSAVASPNPLPASPGGSYPPVTTSVYETGTNGTTLYNQGCTAGKASQSGVVFLDFGRPAFRTTTREYGSIGFAGMFLANVDILSGMEHYAKGYMTCLSSSSSAKLSLARGTNNSCSNEDKMCCPAGCGSQPPSFTAAGNNWAIRTKNLADYLSSQGWTSHLSASAADDAEPAWDPAFTNTGNFLSGFANTYGYTYTMWDYGSLEPGYWTSSQEYSVAYGYLPDVPFPEIYSSTNATEWEGLAKWAAANQKKMKFWGVLSQYVSGKSCGLSATQGYDALLAALNGDASTTQTSIPYLSDIACGSAWASASLPTAGRG